MQSQPLNTADFEAIEDTLLKYGDDHSVLNACELDGFFTALVSGPKPVDIADWFPAIWGGQNPNWENTEEAKQFIELSVRHINTLARQLAEDSQAFIPRFEETEPLGKTVTLAEEWCFGYMRATQVAGWEALPPEQDQLLKAISLHGLEDNFELLDQMSEADIQACVPQVVEAARGLFRYFNKLH